MVPIPHCCMSTHADQTWTYLLIDYQSYTEDISDPWFALSSKVMRQERFTFKEKELCILAVLSEYDVPYVLYAHSQIGIYAGFNEDQIQQAVHGKLPNGLDDREAAIYSLALTLARLHGPMRDGAFEDAKSILRQDQIAGVAHIVSGYIYVAMLSNISGAGAPSGGEGIFQAIKNPKFSTS